MGILTAIFAGLVGKEINDEMKEATQERESKRFAKPNKSRRKK